MNSVVKFVVLPVVLSAVIFGSVFAALEASRNQKALEDKAKAAAIDKDRNAMFHKFENANF